MTTRPLSLAKSAIAGTRVPCSYVIPSPGPGKTLDPQKVNVSFIPDGKPGTVIPKVASAGACSPSKGGWYYDNETSPNSVSLCADMCSSLGSGRVKILFGCKSKVVLD